MTENKHHGTNHLFKRTIRNNPKLNHWRARNSSIQMNEVLNPNDFGKPVSECSCECIDHCPPRVTRTSGGIRWRGKKKKPLPTSKSKYHEKCSGDKISHAKVQPTNLTRNSISSSCDECLKKPKKSKFKNECYCLSPPNKPLLPVKPCVTQPNSKRVIHSGLKTGDGDKPTGYDLQTLKKARNLLDYVPESAFLRKLYNEASKTFDCQCAACKTKCELANMKFTKRRQLLEDAYGDVAVQNLNDLATMNYRCKLKGDCMQNFKTSTSVDRPFSMSPQYSPRTSRHFTYISPADTPRSPQRYDSEFSPKTSPKMSQHLDSQCHDFGYSPNFNSGEDMNPCVTDHDKICMVKRIRDKNYFDTHSTSFNLSSQNIPPHKCVHKFVLDDRLLPAPLHSDAFGVSRCSKCNKPMAYATEEQIYADEKLQKVTDYTKKKSAESMLQNMPQMEPTSNFSRKISEESAVPMIQNMLQRESSKIYERNMPQKGSTKNLNRKIYERSAEAILQNVPQKGSFKNVMKINNGRSAEAVLQNFPSDCGIQGGSSKKCNKKIYERNAVAMLQNMLQKESSKNCTKLGKISASDVQQNMPQTESGKNCCKKVYERSAVAPTALLLQQESSKSFTRKINIASKDEIVELKVPPSPLMLSKISQLKTVVPDNTWALRYQKGVV